MKMRIFNPTNAEVNITLLGVKVVIPSQKADIVSSSVGRALQDIQPQLEYHEIDEDAAKRAEKDVKTKLIAQVEEAEAKVVQVEEQAKAEVKKVKSEKKDLEDKLKEQEKELKKLTKKKDEKVTKK